jgi:hypothetical protein
MTARQARKARRAAERKTRKLESNDSALSARAVRQDEAALLSEPKIKANGPAERETRKLQSNDSALSASERAKPPHCSTGPTTEQGRNTSRWNSFKHGLYAKQLVLPGEDPAELDALRATLRAEHQPATETEEILVNEIAEQFWRLRRMRHFEARGMQPEEFDHWFQNGLLALIARQMASAERGMHKAITALRRLQLDRGFVPSKTAQPAAANVTEPDFVPQNPDLIHFVPSFFAEDEDESPFEIPDHPSFSPPAIENAA